MTRSPRETLVGCCEIEHKAILLSWAPVSAGIATAIWPARNCVSYPVFGVVRVMPAVKPTLTAPTQVYIVTAAKNTAWLQHENGCINIPMA